MKLTYLLSLCLAGVAALCGQVAPKPEAQAIKPFSEDRATYVLGPDDLVHVHVRDAEEISKLPFRIDGRGDLRLPLAGAIHASGLTPVQLEEQITDRLKDLIRDPEVVVSVTEQRSQPVSVIGAVGSPGVFQIQGRKTLIEVLSLAGGLRPDAGNTLTITRRIDRGPIPLPHTIKDDSGQYQVAEISVQSVLSAKNPGENIAVQPHDVVTVPEAQMVYVMGHVKKPGAFPLREQEQVSALMALSLAEGPTTVAAPQHARVLRRQPGSTSRREVPVNLRKVMAGKEGDVGLEPGDILVIPDSLPKSATLRTIEAAIQIGTGWIIWRR